MCWETEVNWEASQPPLYYGLAALWLHLGHFFGLAGLHALYWIRFLNVPLIAALVLIGFAAARKVWPNDAPRPLAVALLLAFLPQDTFYSIQNDVLSPIGIAALFICVLSWVEGERPSIRLGMFTGLLVAAAYLTKISHLPMLAVALAVIAWQIWRAPREPARQSRGAALALLASASLPIVGWMLWCKSHFGDFTGSAGKFAILGWTRKPFAQWWPHPLFSLRGFGTFLSDLLASFWRGEFSWGHETIRSIPADHFYVGSSVLFCLVAAWGICRDRTLGGVPRVALFTGLITFVASIGFLAALSIQFDFGPCINPSRAHPYFTSGRLLTGALVPFAIVYVYGLDRLLRLFQGARLLLIVLAIIGLLVSRSEFVISRPVFESEHNWLHL